MANNQRIDIPVTVVNLVGSTHFAATTLGGITVRGPKASSPLDAVQNLLWRLAGRDNDDDAEMALELLIAGTTIGDQLTLPPPDDVGS